MSTNRIDLTGGFPDADAADTYFEDVEEMSGMIGVYGFRTVPELKALLRERSGGSLSEEEILETAKAVFRNKPPEDAAVIVPEDRQVVDFRYQF